MGYVPAQRAAKFGGGLNSPVATRAELLGPLSSIWEKQPPSLYHGSAGRINLWLCGRRCRANR
eukprot:8579069-Alexandrium_andersonii.AAC.1